MATINGKSVNVSFEGIAGYGLNDLCFHSPAEVKEKIYAAQKAIRDLLDLGNGESNILCSEISRRAYSFDDFISQFVADVPHEIRTICGGEVTVTNEDFSDVPFIRIMDSDCCVKNFKVTE